MRLMVTILQSGYKSSKISKYCPNSPNWAKCLNNALKIRQFSICLCIFPKICAKMLKKANFGQFGDLKVKSIKLIKMSKITP